METSVRRSSRPVKKKKFFIDEIENIYSTNKKSTTSVPIEENTIPVDKAEKSQNLTLPTPSFQKINDIAKPKIIKKKSISKYTKLGTQIKNRYATFPQKKKLDVKLESNSSLENASLQLPEKSLDQLGKWKPIDDLKLIINTIQCNDLRRVKQSVKFTCNFTLQEIEERWYNLLYDPVISSLSKKGLNVYIDKPEIIARCYEEALFSEDEERILSTILSNKQHSLDHFENLLKQYPSIFLPTRTSKQLQEHWLLMKHHTLLPDQIVSSSTLKWNNPLINFASAHIDPAIASELSFEDMEKLALVSTEIGESMPNKNPTLIPVALTKIATDVTASTTKNNLESLTDAGSPINTDTPPFNALKQFGCTMFGIGGVKQKSNGEGGPYNWVFDKEYELGVMHRFQKIEQLENQLPLWQAVIDKEMGLAPEFDDSTFAALQGKIIRFLIKSREVSFGRYATNYAASLVGEKHIDIDLSLEGPCRKVSRLQGHIRLKSSLNLNNTISYDFYITNEGKRPIFIEGKPIMPGQAAKCRDKALIEVSYLQFTFQINNRLLNQLKEQS